MSEWINVKDSFPDRHQHVLVFYNGKFSVANCYLECFFPICECGEKEPLFSVTHWMPLPTKPKELL